MILIATAGRAGSSFLMKFLYNCGMDTGTDTWYDLPNAGMEHKDIVSINNDLIGNIIKNKDSNMWFIWGRIADLKLDVYKDPQLVIHPDIIKNWWHVRHDIKVIFLYRNAVEVVDSLMKIPEWTGPNYRCFPEMVEQKNDDFLKMCVKLKIPVKKFKFPGLLGEANEVIESLSDWIEFPDNALNIWKRLRR